MARRFSATALLLLPAFVVSQDSAEGLMTAPPPIASAVAPGRLAGRQNSVLFITNGCGYGSDLGIVSCANPSRTQCYVATDPSAGLYFGCWGTSTSGYVDPRDVRTACVDGASANGSPQLRTVYCTDTSTVTRTYTTTDVDTLSGVTRTSRWTTTTTRTYQYCRTVRASLASGLTGTWFDCDTTWGDEWMVTSTSSAGVRSSVSLATLTVGVASSSTTTTPVSTTPVASPPPPSPVTAVDGPKGLTAGEIGGIVGGGIGGIALLACGFCIWWARRRKRNNASTPAAPAQAAPLQYTVPAMPSPGPESPSYSKSGFGAPSWTTVPQAPTPLGSPPLTASRASMTPEHSPVFPTAHHQPMAAELASVSESTTVVAELEQRPLQSDSLHPIYSHKPVPFQPVQHASTVSRAHSTTGMSEISFFSR